MADIQIKDDKTYYCTYCNATLDTQEGFSPKVSTWICKKCGNYLRGELPYEGERFPDTTWHCDGCGDLLNEQPGFRDIYRMWICRKCGHIEHFDTIFEGPVISSIE